MRGIVAVPLIWLAVLVIWYFTTASSVGAVEDLGEPDVLRAACASISMEATAQGVTLAHCRQTAPADFAPDGRSVTVHLSVFVKEAGTRRTADVFLHKSLWHENGFVLTN